jgi:hypothetical protein
MTPARDSFADALDEARAFADRSAREHYEAFAALCTFTDAVLLNHPDRDALLAAHDPLPETARLHIESLKRRR